MATMTRTIRTGPWGRPLSFAAILALMAAWSPAPAAYAGPAQPVVPAAIEVPDGHKVFLVGRAVGVQLYACNATPSGYGWGFVAPRADLFDGRGKLVTTHFGGPTWRARDGSSVVGRVIERATVDTGAIPWLLLAADSTAAGADGDRLAGTTYIQRIATTGGLAPAAAECSAATLGSTREVPYTADYYFWKATGG